jgi:hypothetical protein
MSWLGKYMFASMLLVLIMTSAQAAQQPAPKDPAGSFQVEFNDGYLSVSADQAPLINIFDEIRKQARITVHGSITPEEKITIQFKHVLLEDALKRLAKNISIIYAKNPKDKSRRITGIVVLPEGPRVAAKRTESTESSEAGGAPQPEPFKFEFDPTKAAEKKTQ